MVELKPVACGCGGEVWAVMALYPDYAECPYICQCRKCHIKTAGYETKAEAIEAWNKSMSERTAKVEKVDMNSPHNQVYRCCKCGQYMHKTAWSRGVVYCSSCGAKLEWE